MGMYPLNSKEVTDQYGWGLETFMVTSYKTPTPDPGGFLHHPFLRGFYSPLTSHTYTLVHHSPPCVPVRHGFYIVRYLPT